MNKKSAWTQSTLQEVCTFGEIQKGEQYARTCAGTRRTRDARGVSKTTTRVSRKRVYFSRTLETTRSLEANKFIPCEQPPTLVEHASELTFSRCMKTNQGNNQTKYIEGNQDGKMFRGLSRTYTARGGTAGRHCASNAVLRTLNHGLKQLQSFPGAHFATPCSSVNFCLCNYAL